MLNPVAPCSYQITLKMPSAGKFTSEQLKVVMKINLLPRQEKSLYNA